MVHFSSQRDNWKTPKRFYEQLDKEFDFDPCPSEPTFNGLTCPWGRANFINPPYGRQIGKWLAKGLQEWKLGKTCVFLIPSRTDTRWWHQYCMIATEIRYIKGRLHFDDQPNPAPFPSALAIFKGN